MRALEVLLSFRQKGLDGFDAKIRMLKCFRNTRAFDLISCALILIEVRYGKPVNDLHSFICLYVFATLCC